MLRQDASQFIETVLNSQYPPERKEILIKNIIESVSPRVSFWQKGVQQKVYGQVLEDYLRQLVKKVESKKLTSMPLEEHEFSLINADIRKAILNDKNAKFLAKLAKEDLDEVTDDYLIVSFQEAASEFKEACEDMEKYEDVMKTAFMGISIDFS